MCSCPGDLGREEDEGLERPELPRRRTDGPPVYCPHHHPFRNISQRSQSVCPGELQLDTHRIRDRRSRRRLNREDVEHLDTRTGAAGPLNNPPAQEYSPKLLAIAGVMIATGELDRLSLGSSHSRSRNQSLSQASQISIGGSSQNSEDAVEEEDEEELAPLPPIKPALGALGRRKTRAMSMVAPLSNTPFSFAVQAGKSGLSSAPTRRSSTGNQLLFGQPNKGAPMPPVNSPALGQQVGTGPIGIVRPGTGTPAVQGPFGSSTFRSKRPAPRRLSELWNASWENDNDDDDGEDVSSEGQSNSPGQYDLDSPRFTGAREDDVSPGGGANAETPRLSWPSNLDRVDQSLREQGEYFGSDDEDISPTRSDSRGSPGWTETKTETQETEEERRRRRSSDLTLRNTGDRTSDGTLTSDGHLTVTDDRSNPTSDTSPSACEFTHCEHAGYFFKIDPDDEAGHDEELNEIELDEDDLRGVMQRSGSSQTIIHTPTRQYGQEVEDD